MQGFYLAIETSPLFEQYQKWKEDDEKMVSVFNNIRETYGIESTLFKGFRETLAIRPTWNDVSKFKDLLDLSSISLADKPVTGQYPTNDFCSFFPLKEISIMWSDMLYSSGYQFIQQPIPMMYTLRVKGHVKSSIFDYAGKVYCEILAEGDILVDECDFKVITGHDYINALDEKLRGTSVISYTNIIEPRVSTLKLTR